jgi:hypothetical protein
MVKESSSENLILNAVLERSKEAVGRLQQAAHLADDTNMDRWQFAVDLASMLGCGTSPTDLRWLVANGFVDHAMELTLPGAPQRVFQGGCAMRFTAASCFVLSKAGAQVISGRGVADSPIPHWSSQRRELSYAGVVVKRFRRPAPNQELVLTAFEEESWTVRIDDPMPPQAGKDSKQRLHDTINALNRNQVQPLLRFLGDGTGEGICWKAQSGS